VKVAVKALAAIARNARHTDYLRSLATSGLRYDQEQSVPSLYLLDAYPAIEAQPVDLGEVSMTRWSMDPMEVFVLSALAQLRRPKRIFELGTYDGSTTARLAAAVPEAELFTIDLPEDQIAAYHGASSSTFAFAGVGSVYKGTSASARITQLFGDTRTFDFTPWRGSIDMVVVDADHAYEPAFADSNSALELLSPSGMIVWDDYGPFWPSVRRAVRDFSVSHGAPVFHILNTDLAVFDRQRPSV
jgi:predicted O-methyltransferase YrrM